MQEAGPTEFEGYMEEVEFGSRRLVDVKLSIGPFLLKQNPAIRLGMQ